MDDKKILRLKKRRLMLDGNEEIALVATTIKDIPAAAGTENRFKRTRFNIHRPMIRTLHPLKRDASSSTPTILKTNSPFYQIVPQVPKIVSLAKTDFHDMVKRLGGPSLGKATGNATRVEDEAAMENLKAHIRVGGVFSRNKVNELPIESETFPENRERDEFNNHEYAFGRAIGLMLKHIEDVNSKLQVETKIFSIICKELERKY